MNVKVAVGSTNPVKMAAVQTTLRRVFTEAEFIARRVDSGVSEQPWGNDETRQGALNRAHAVRQATEATYGIGLEGGLVDTPVGVMTCAWCAMVDGKGRVGYGGGAHMLIPPMIAEIIKQHGELGAAMDALVNEVNTKQAQGAIGILTNGLSSRQAAYEQLVAMAAAPFVTGYYL